MQKLVCALFLACLYLPTEIHGSIHDTLTNNGYFYNFFAGDGKNGNNVHWSTARDKCNSYGVGTLAIIRSQAMNDDVNTLLDKYGSDRRSYIGASDLYTEGNWIWVDGTTAMKGQTYTAWGSGEPNDYRGEDCLSWKTDGEKWNDEDCDHYYGFVCTQSVSKLVPEQFTTLTFGKTASGSSYKTAADKCISDNSRLVVVTRDELYHKIQNDVNRDSSKKYWVGARQNGAGKLMWADGHELNLNKWGLSLDKLSSERGEKCLALGSNGLELHGCDEALDYICEYVVPWDIKKTEDRSDFMVGENVELECTASGYPLPNVTWYKGDSVVTREAWGDVYQESVSGKSTLVIKNAQLRNSRRYKCFATNAHTETNMQTYVDVRVHPHDLTRVIDQVQAGSASSSRSLSSQREIDSPSIHVITPQQDCKDVPENSWMLPTVFGLNIAMLLVLMALVYSRARN